LRCDFNKPLSHHHLRGAVGLYGDGELCPAHCRDRCGGLDLKARGRVRQRLYAIMAAALPLVENDNLATPIPQGTHLRQGDFRLGLQIGPTSIEENQRGGRKRAGADSVSCLQPLDSRRRQPGLAAGGQNLHHAAR